MHASVLCFSQTTSHVPPTGVEQLIALSERLKHLKQQQEQKNNHHHDPCNASGKATNSNTFLMLGLSGAKPLLM